MDAIVRELSTLTVATFALVERPSNAENTDCLLFGASLLNADCMFRPASRIAALVVTVLRGGVDEFTPKSVLGPI
jgi:hypothetical protein